MRKLIHTDVGNCFSVKNETVTSVIKVIISLAISFVLGATCRSETPAPDMAKPGKELCKDIYGDPLPPGAIARMGKIRRPDKSWVTCVVFSPDGKTLASASYDKTVRLWEVASSKEIRQFQGQQDRVKSVAFSPDGKMLASAGWDKTVRLWDIASGKETHKLKGHNLPITAVVFSPDGKKLASASGDKTVRLWDWASESVSKKPAVRSCQGKIGCLHEQDTLSQRPHRPPV